MPLTNDLLGGLSKFARHRRREAEFCFGLNQQPPVLVGFHRNIIERSVAFEANALCFERS
jgi:hypothetical protein